MKRHVPSCLGAIIGFFTAMGIHFAVLKPLGIDNTGILTFLIIVGIFGGATLFNMFAPEGWRENSDRRPWENHPPW